MEDITLFFWIGGFLALALQYYVKVPPTYFIGELLGIGGLVRTFTEVENQTIGDDVGLLMTIAMIIVILYSTINLVGHYWPVKGGWKQ